MENYWSFQFKEMGTNYFLEEASGDSDELDFDPNNNSNSNFGHHDQDPYVFSASVNGDDAESCSCDASDYYSCVSNFNQFRSFEEEEEEVSVHHMNGRMEEEEDEVEQKRWGNSENLKSCVSIDSTDNEGLSEMEKNRLFWENCLAS